MNVTDGVNTPATGTYNLNATLAANAAPTFFNGSGKMLIPLGVSHSYGNSVLQQSDGKLLIAGYGRSGTVNEFGFVRLNTDGTQDTSFDLDGKLLVGVVGASDIPTKVIAQSNGQLVAVGASVIAGSNHDFSAVRLNTADGSLDTTFDIDGKFSVSLDNMDSAQSVLQQTDGKLVMVGVSGLGSPSPAFGVVRLNTDGSLAVVVLNRSERDIAFSLAIDGVSHATDLPAHAIATYVQAPGLR